MPKFLLHTHARAQNAYSLLSASCVSVFVFASEVLITPDSCFIDNYFRMTHWKFCLKFIVYKGLQLYFHDIYTRLNDIGLKGYGRASERTKERERERESSRAWQRILSNTYLNLLSKKHMRTSGVSS